MKLARPDVFHPQIALAGCPQLPAGDGDDEGLVAALRSRGLHARWLSWDDPATLRADLVILRATWDYVDRLDEFLPWTRQVSHLLNAPEAVAWNTDKRYLVDLERAGVATVPTSVFAPGERVQLPTAPEVVVKPSIGVGSVGARRFTSRGRARAHAEALQAQGGTVLVQEYDRRVDRDGETALVFLAGRQSHAFGKRAMLPPEGREPELDETGTYAIERLYPADPDFEVWDVGAAALTAAAERLDIDVTEFLYARVDVIGDRHDPRLLELELVEPSLGWGQLDPDTRSLRQRDFTLALESALDRLGMGPLSHRRP
ncbi:MAG: hypothetical protein JO152_17110 [Mycobacteriaceae bacterium]|nr:hypothetical protein [Mycobacteriaceae bacterium]